MAKTKFEFQRNAEHNEMRAFTSFVMLVASIAVFLSHAAAQDNTIDVAGFECGFIYEKNEKGKSGDATCTYTPDKVFADTSLPFPAQEHCETKKVFSTDDIRLRVDFLKKRVIYERDEGLAPHALERMVRYYMQKDKLSKEEALKKATWKPSLTNGPFDQPILFAQKNRASHFSDPITQTLLKEPKAVSNYSVVFGYTTAEAAYTLFIPENGNAILSKPWASEDASWISMRFGKCRPVK